ncbi:diguanylate cyclase domain-containing protein [Azotobacter vinelandii]|uniref:diguanylate cyclase domain-containing protein n=1 Tax=Azotobacter vinelandii TaxID=354 RepID=UPI002666C77E|nr:diguanylate cyclase [Azotobacter vinelandii]WKN20389.1 diguanylate cyclase [Azotobacter vinelandii]
MPIPFQPVHLPCSISVAAWNADEAENFDAVMRRADEALYSAKSAGRGRVSRAAPRRIRRRIRRRPATEPLRDSRGGSVNPGERQGLSTDPRTMR